MSFEFTVSRTIFARYFPPSGRIFERSISTSFPSQSHIPPMYHLSPLRRAITTYLPISPSIALVSSQTLGVWAMNSSNLPSRI